MTIQTLRLIASHARAMTRRLEALADAACHPSQARALRTEADWARKLADEAEAEAEAGRERPCPAAATLAAIQAIISEEWDR